MCLAYGAAQLTGGLAAALGGKTESDSLGLPS
jgi:hypothetical protein